jgi:hypothetical protein
MADLGLGGNDTSGRIKHATGQNFAQNVPTKHVFGTPEEIQARVGGTFSTLPDNKPSNFRQLGPSAPGGNVNDLKPTGRSGNQKYGNPRSHA